MSENILDLRPGALLTSELSVRAAAASSSLLGPVTSLCHILFSRGLPPSPSVSARHWPRNTVLMRLRPRSVLGEFLYTGRNKRFEFEFQSLTLVPGHQKPPQRLWDPSQLPLHLPVLPSFFLLSLLGMTEKSSSPHRPHPPCCWWIVFVSTGVALEKWSAMISSRQAHCFHSHAHCVIAMEIREWFRPFTEGNVKSLPVKKWNYCFDGFWWRGA